MASCRTPQESDRPYDPDAGIDPSGRIEKPVLPAGLSHPERWRYTPAGRLKPGNFFDRFLVTSFVSPIVFREEDVGVGGGLAFTDLDFRSRDGSEVANLVVTYSADGQQQYRIDWVRWLHHRKLDGGGIIRDERSTLGAYAEASRTLTRRFFGFGSKTSRAAESSYTQRLAATGIDLRLALPDPGDDVRLNAGVSVVLHGLSRGKVKGLPSTDAAFPLAFANGDGVDQLWLNGGIAHDTRDSLHQPYSGWRAGFNAAAAVAQSGMKPGAIFSVDTGGVLAVPALLHDGGDAGEVNPPTDVIAFGAFVSKATGDLPFYSLPTLGGASTLRGYVQNRFTDRVAAHASFEYRIALIPRGYRFTRSIRIERVGLAFFYDFGTVANDLDQVTKGAFLDSIGIGLRVAFAREAMFRVDLGRSDEGTVATIAFGNAF